MRGLWKILLLVFIISLMSACTMDEEKEVNLNFNYDLSSVVSRVVKNNAPTRAVDAVTGTMTIVDTTDGTERVFNWYGTLDEDNFTASSNSTIILSPGEYNFNLVFTSGGYQYAGEVLNYVIIDGENTVNFTLQPIIGETVTNINLTQLSSLKFQYDSVELGNLSNPVIGLIVDGGNETQFTINPNIGLSENYINLSMGEHKIELKLYDNGIQIGKSIVAQEDVILGLTNVNMDLVPLHGETMFNLSLDGGDAVFSFVIPKEVVEEVGVLANLKTIFKIVGNINTLREEEISLTLNGDGNYEGQVILSDYRYDVVTMSLEFYDISTSPEDLIGSSVIEGANLLKDSVNLTYAVDLKRRSVVTGNLLGILGVNVYDTENLPVAGAKIYANDELIGITGSGIFGNAGYLKAYLPAGDYTVEAVGESYRGEVATNLAVLGIENENIILDTEVEIIPKVEMVTVSAGTTSIDNGNITLNYDLEVGRYEITHTEFIKFLNNFEIDDNGKYNGVKLIDIGFDYSAIDYDGEKYYFKGSNYTVGVEAPVSLITWFGVIAYCNWLSEKHGLIPAYDLSNWESLDNSNLANIQGYRLPSISEWEYVARGGIKGNATVYSGSDNLEDVAWYALNTGQVSQVVGSKEANELGIYDMSGNIAEYVNYKNDRQSFVYGGSCGLDSRYAEVNSYIEQATTSVRLDVGFRVVRTKIEK